jgi:hypothetical protein
MKEKALILKTGEIFDVESSYIIATMQVSFELEEALIKEVEEHVSNSKKVPHNLQVSNSLWVFNDNKDTTPHKEGTQYLLSNNKRYHEDDLIIGLEKIREFKLNEIL